MNTSNATNIVSSSNISTSGNQNNTSGLSGQFGGYFVVLDSGQVLSIESLIREYQSLKMSNTALGSRDIQNTDSFHFECGNIGKTTTIDLSNRTDLKIVKVGDLDGSIIFPSSITKLECGYIYTSIFNLSHCTNLKAVKMGSFGGRNIKFPSSITQFECGIISQNLDLSHCTNLKVIKTGDRNANTSFPASITNFECGFTSCGLHDLSHCTNLKAVKMGNFSGMAEVKFPSSVTDFEYAGGAQQVIQLDRIGSLISSFPNLTTLKIGGLIHCYETLLLLLPPSLTDFEYVVKLTQHPQCKTKLLPPFLTIDLLKCKGLIRVKLGDCDGVSILLPPPTQKLLY